MLHTSHLRLAPDFAATYDSAPPKVSWLFGGLTPFAMSCVSAKRQLRAVLAWVSSSMAAHRLQGRQMSAGSCPA